MDLKDRAASPGTSAVSPIMAAGKPSSTGPRTWRCAIGASASGDSQRIQRREMGRFLVGSLSDTDAHPGTDHSSDTLNVILCGIAELFSWPNMLMI